jgi:hypothetical protein
LAKTARKNLAHWIDAAFDHTYKATDYQLIGADLTEFNIELNPQVESNQNILGENSVVHSGYEVSSSASPVYHDFDKVLESKLIELAMNRRTGDECKTSYVEVLYQEGENGEFTPVHCFREDVLVIPTSYGGDTTGVQVPYDVHYCGNRVKGTFNKETRTFTASNGG